MAKKKRWQYCSAKGGSHGTMICTACQKKVTEGEYRVNETEEAYHVQHRACSKIDPKWAELDSQGDASIKSVRTRLAAYITFRDEWNESALNEEIEEMQTFLNSDYVKAFEQRMEVAAVASSS
ncbi:hypothetical protein G3A43_07815 [Paraburkholderia aspalathi]|nr:hypothetical protein [Paraburkholderia aspalathi]MBK3780162.1 hypothetical protein [Paraburkholderia aspalathi]